MARNNNKRSRNSGRRGGASVRASNVGQAMEGASHTTMMRGPTDPPKKCSDLLADFRARIVLTGPPSSPLTVTPSTVAAALPAAGVPISAIRIRAIHAWGADTNTIGALKVNIPNPVLASGPGLPSNWWSDGSAYTDQRVVGQSRAAIHLKPPQLMREMWWSPNDTSSVWCTITPDGATTADVGYADFTVQVRSNNAPL